MKRLALIGLLLAAFWPTAANAAVVPCRNKIYNDWYADGKISTSYPVSCYRDAIKHVSNDAKIYSSLVDDIKSAMQAAIAREHHKKVPAEVGKGKGVNTSATGDKGKGKGGGKTSTTSTNPTTTSATTTSAIGGGSNTSGGGGGGIPTPIIILGALAILLAAAGAAGTGVRYYRRRGGAPPPA